MAWRATAELGWAGGDPDAPFCLQRTQVDPKSQGAEEAGSEAARTAYAWPRVVAEAGAGAALWGRQAGVPVGESWTVGFNGYF